MVDSVPLEPRVDLSLYPAGWGWSEGVHVDQVDGLSLVLSGRVRERMGRDEVWAGPGQVVVKPGDAAHRTSFEADTVVLRMCWPGMLTAGAMTPSWQWHRVPAFAAAVLRAVESLRHGCTSEAASLVLELPGVGLSDCSGTRSPANAPSWLLQFDEELADRAHEGIQVSSLATTTGRHPVSVARLYRLHFGISPSAAMQRYRLGRSAAGVILDSAPLSSAAISGGFCDQSHLHRTCRAVLGLTPRDALSGMAGKLGRVASVQDPTQRLLYPSRYEQ